MNLKPKEKKYMKKIKFVGKGGSPLSEIKAITEAKLGEDLENFDLKLTTNNGVFELSIEQPSSKNSFAILKFFPMSGEKFLTASGMLKEYDALDSMASHTMAALIKIMNEEVIKLLITEKAN